MLIHRPNINVQILPTYCIVLLSTPYVWVGDMQKLIYDTLDKITDNIIIKFNFTAKNIQDNKSAP